MKPAGRGRGEAHRLCDFALQQREQLGLLVPAEVMEGLPQAGGERAAHAARRSALDHARGTGQVVLQRRGMRGAQMRRREQELWERRELRELIARRATAPKRRE